jgi:hypothetical protein
VVPARQRVLEMLQLLEKGINLTRALHRFTQKKLHIATGIMQCIITVASCISTSPSLPSVFHDPGSQRHPASDNPTSDLRPLPLSVGYTGPRGGCSPLSELTFLTPNRVRRKSIDGLEILRVAGCNFKRVGLRRRTDEVIDNALFDGTVSEETGGAPGISLG